MFDRTFISAPKETTYVDHNVTITEKRAPTDESVKLLAEMERAAENKVIGHGEIKNNTLAAEWFISEDLLNWRYNVAVRVKLNGGEHIIKFTLEDEYKDDLDTLIDVVRGKVAERIADDILLPAFGSQTFRRLVKG